MAPTKPKVGDKAIIDGQQLTVTAVEPGKRAKVELADDVALVAADAVAEVRASFVDRQVALDKAFAAAFAEEDVAMRRQATGPLKVELDALHNQREAALASHPRGQRVGVALKDLEWVEVAQAWSVPGRLLSYADRRKARRRGARV